MKSIKILALIAVSVFPVMVGAQQYLKNTDGILGAARGIVEDILLPIAFILSLLYFFWGVAKYIKSEGDGKAEGKQIMIWGVVAIFVVSSVWGIVYFVRDELNINDDSAINMPTIRN